MKIFVEGKEAFLKRLDTYFTHVQDGFDQNSYMGLFQISNEPAFLVPSLYNYVNRPDKSIVLGIGRYSGFCIGKMSISKK